MSQVARKPSPKNPEPLIKAIIELGDSVEKLPEQKREFAASVLRQSRNKRLSDKQAEWVFRLLNEVNSPAEQPAPTVAPASNLFDYDLSPLVTLLTTAKASGLQWPKITITTPDGDKVQIGMAGPRSLYPGSLNVTDGGPFGSNRWYGRVLESRFAPNPDFDRTEPQLIKRINTMLAQLAAEPEETIKEYGHRTGNCACCSRPLTDALSVSRGIGPVCFEKWGFYRLKGLDL